ncbi:hypothetical protein STEG23_036980, partial [Scotinomys teguina]
MDTWEVANRESDNFGCRIPGASAREGLLSHSTNYSIVYMNHIFLIHSSVDGHLGCFQVLAITNNAAMNIVEHVSLERNRRRSEKMKGSSMLMVSGTKEVYNICGGGGGDDGDDDDDDDDGVSYGVEEVRHHSALFPKVKSWMGARFLPYLALARKILDIGARLSPLDCTSSLLDAVPYP